jgi:pimeloyl-ACP methyl ester carboxylesterase
MAETVGPVEPIAADVGGIAVTGLIARVDRPRAVLLAMHGGGSRAAYFDGSVDPDQSLLRLAAGLGFTAVAFDQPGYAASAGQVDGWSLEQRADLVARALAATVDDVGAGVVVVAHSQGAQLSVYLSAGSPRVIGLEMSGSGVRLQTRAPIIAPKPDPGRLGRQAFELIWGDPGLYPAGALARENTRSSAAPAAALDDALAWPTRLPEIAAQVTVPVRLTLAEHEQVWDATPEGQAGIAALFTAAPWVQTALQPDAPHNISLSLAARAYHLHVLAFADECGLWARRSGRAGEAARGYART